MAGVRIRPGLLLAIIIQISLSKTTPAINLYSFFNTDAHFRVIFIFSDNQAQLEEIARHTIASTLPVATINIEDVFSSDYRNFTDFGNTSSFSRASRCPLDLMDVELILIDLSPANQDLDLIFATISLCSSSAKWKPIIVIKGVANNLRLQQLEALSLKANFSINSNIFVVTDSANPNTAARPSGGMTSSQNMSEVHSRISDDANTSSLWEVYTIKSLSFVNELTSSTNLPEDFDILALVDGRAQRRGNFAHAPILGAVENSPEFPLESLLETVDGKLRFVSGVSVDLFLDLEKALNFSAVPVQGEGWLMKDEETLKWLGTGRQIMAGDVDVGVTQTFLYASRSDFAFLLPNYAGSILAYFRQPPASSINDIFKHPFSPSVWLLLVLTFSLTFIVIQCIVSYKTSQIPKTGQLPDSPDSDSDLETDFALFIFASICQQGWCSHPKSTSLKVIFLCTTTSGYLLYISFSAALVSTLTNEIEPIQNAVDLFASRLTLIGDKYIPFVVSILESIYKVDNNVLEDRKIAFDSAEINPTARVAQEPCAYMGYSDDFVSTLRALNKSDHFFCDKLSHVRVSTSRLKSGMVVRKDSPFIEYLNYGLTKTIEKGLNHARVERYKRRSRIMCDPKLVSYRQNLDIGDVFSAYIILALGTTISVCIALAERLLFSKRANKLFT